MAAAAAKARGLEAYAKGDYASAAYRFGEAISALLKLQQEQKEKNESENTSNKMGLASGGGESKSSFKDTAGPGNRIYKYSYTEYSNTPAIFSRFNNNLK